MIFHTSTSASLASVCPGLDDEGEEVVQTEVLLGKAVILLVPVWSSAGPAGVHQLVLLASQGSQGHNCIIMNIVFWA